MPPLPPFPTLETLLQQANPLLGTPLLLIIALSVMVTVAARDWRLVIASFVVVYGALAILTATLLPPQWALLRVVTGGMAGIIWYLSAQQAGWGGRFLPFQRSEGVQARPLATTGLLRILLALALAGVLLVLRPRLPLAAVTSDVRFVVVWLGAFAVLGMALGEEALQVGVSLLFWLAGTQLLLAALEQNAWTFWLLSSLELLLALATGYLMVARGPAWRVEPEDGR